MPDTTRRCRVTGCTCESLQWSTRCTKHNVCITCEALLDPIWSGRRCPGCASAHELAERTERQNLRANISGHNGFADPDRESPRDHLDRLSDEAEMLYRDLK